MRDDSHIPFGTRATVVGFMDTLAEVILDSAVLGASTLGGRCSQMRGATLPMTYFLNLAPKGNKAPSSAAGSKGAGKGRGKALSKQGGKGGGKGKNTSEVSQIQGTPSDWNGKPQFPHTTAPNNLPAAKAKHFENRKKLIPARKDQKFAPPVPKAVVQYSETNQYSAVAAPAEGQYDSDGEEIVFVPVSRKKSQSKPRTAHPAQKKLMSPADMVRMQQQAGAPVQAAASAANEPGNMFIKQLAENLQMPQQMQMPQPGLAGNIAAPPQPLFAMMPPPIPMTGPGMMQPGMMPPPQMQPGMMPMPMPGMSMSFPMPQANSQVKQLAQQHLGKGGGGAAQPQAQPSNPEPKQEDEI